MNDQTPNPDPIAGSETSPERSPRTRPSVPRQGDFAPAFTGNPLAEGSVPAPTSSGDFKPAFMGNPLAAPEGEQTTFEAVNKRPRTRNTGGHGNPFHDPPRDPKEGEDELMQAAVQEARVASETRALPTDRPLTDQERQETIAAVSGYLERKKISFKLPARQLNIGQSTISQVLSGSYTGNRDKIIRLLNQWIEKHSRGERPGLPTHMVNTSVCERMLAVCQAAQDTGKMAIITGPAGNSKSMVCQAVERRAVQGIPVAYHIELDAGHGTRLAFVKRVAEKLKLPTSGTLGRLMDAVIEKLSGSDHMLLIDEAHFMDERARQVALGIHKRARVPIVFFATEIFDKNADDTDKFDGQFTSHLVWRYRITAEQEQHPGRRLYSTDDIINLARSQQLRISRDAADYLAGLASVPGLGSIRLCSLLMFRANLAAKRTASGTIEIEHVRSAWEKTHGSDRVRLSETRSDALRNRRRTKTG